MPCLCVLVVVYWWRITNTLFAVCFAQICCEKTTLIQTNIEKYWMDTKIRYFYHSCEGYGMVCLIIFTCIWWTNILYPKSHFIFWPKCDFAKFSWRCLCNFCTLNAFTNNVCVHPTMLKGEDLKQLYKKQWFAKMENK